MTANPDPYPLPEAQAFDAIGYLLHKGSLTVGFPPAYPTSRRAISWQF